MSKKLDVGCGHAKPTGWSGMDRRPHNGVDIVHDIEVLPWPIKDSSYSDVRMNHVLEHLDPRNMVDIFDEVWRVLEPNGLFHVAVPYAGSFGGMSDPTHMRSGFTERSFEYFDPSYPMYRVYQSKPYTIIKLDYTEGVEVQVLLRSQKKVTR